MRSCESSRGGEPNAGEPPSCPGLGWSLLQVPLPAPPLPKSIVLLRGFLAVEEQPAAVEKLERREALATAWMWPSAHHLVPV